MVNFKIRNLTVTFPDNTDIISNDILDKCRKIEQILIKADAFRSQYAEDAATRCRLSQTSILFVVKTSAADQARLFVYNTQTKTYSQKISSEIFKVLTNDYVLGMLDYAVHHMKTINEMEKILGVELSQPKTASADGHVRETRYEYNINTITPENDLQTRFAQAKELSRQQQERSQRQLQTRNHSHMRIR